MSYLSLYSEDFQHSGMSKAEWSGFRMQVFESRSLSRAQIRDLMLFADPAESNLHMSRFTQELETTRRMFQNSNWIQLQWNQIIADDLTDESRRSRIIRSFNLAISIEGSDVLRGDGNVNFTLIRSDTSAVWRLSRWRDESEL